MIRAKSSKTIKSCASNTQSEIYSHNNTKNKTILNYIERRLLEYNLTNQNKTKDPSLNIQTFKELKTRNSMKTLNKSLYHPKSKKKNNVLTKNSTNEKKSFQMDRESTQQFTDSWSQTISNDDNCSKYYFNNSSITTNDLVFLKAENLKLKSLVEKYKEKCDKLEIELNEEKRKNNNIYNETQNDRKNYFINYKGKDNIDKTPFEYRYKVNQLKKSSTINSLSISEDES